MNINDILALYQDKMFILFPLVSWLIGVAGFFLFTIPLTWIAWKQPSWAEKYRIQARRGLGEKIVWPAIKYSFFNHLIALLAVSISWPLLKHSGIHDGSLPAWYVILGQVVVFVYLDDFIYYWFHRTFHGKFLYRWIHSIHHRPTVPWAIVANYMHPIEFLVTINIVLLVPILLGSHVVTLWIWVLFRQWIGAEGHCGYDFPWNPSRLFPFYEGSSYHDFHHAKFTGNYSGFTGYLDRIFGTRSPGYEKHLESQKISMNTN